MDCVWRSSSCSVIAFRICGERMEGKVFRQRPCDEDRSDRGVATGKPDGRFFAGIFCRRNDRRPDHQPCAGQLTASDLASFNHAIQGRAQSASRYRTQAERRCLRRGLGGAIRQSRSDHGAANRCGKRPAPVGSQLRKRLSRCADTARKRSKGYHAANPVKLTPQEQSRLARNQSVNPEAYDYYLRGRFRFYDRNREDLEAAIGLLENSVKLDPNFALPHAYLARAYSGKAFLYQHENSHLKEMALAHLDQALALGPDLAEAHFARAGILWTHSNHFPPGEVVRELRRAIELNPNFDEAHQELGAVYNHIGLLDKGAGELQQALAINPTYSGARFRLGINQLSQGKYEQALLFFNDTQRFIPSMWTFQTSLALFELDRKKEASTLISEFLRTEPQDEGGVVTAMQALLLADSGRRSDAEQMIQVAIKKAKASAIFTTPPTPWALLTL